MSYDTVTAIPVAVSTQLVIYVESNRSHYAGGVLAATFA